MRGRKTAAAALVALALSACTAQSGLSKAQERRLRADPSKVVATELAFARTAQEKGQWTAFAQFAAADAVMFVPEAVNARQWLKGRANPPVAVRWQPHHVWSSCDGSLAVAKGAWQRPDSVGYFTTVWERQGSGSYKWVMDQGSPLQQTLAGQEMIGATAAACGLPPAGPAFAAAPVGEIRQGVSKDGTLAWQVVVQPDRSRTVIARYWDGASWRDAISERVAAP